MDGNQPDENRPVQPSLLVPKFIIPSKPTSGNQPPPAPSSPLPAAVPQLKYLAPVESTMNVMAIIDQVLSEKVFLPVDVLHGSPGYLGHNESSAPKDPRQCLPPPQFLLLHWFIPYPASSLSGKQL